MRVLAFALALAVAACAGAPPSTQGTPRPAATSPAPLPSISPPPAGTAAAPLDAATIYIRNHAYLPATVYVKQGGYVTWVNQDAAIHTATPENGASFHATGDIQPASDSGRVTFATAGEQDYTCSYHPDEHGKVMVIAR